VEKDFPKKGPKGWYSTFWIILEEKSFIKVKPAILSWAS